MFSLINFPRPTFSWIDAFFHPVLRDHVITINKIEIPKIKTHQVTALFHKRQASRFERKIGSNWKTERDSGTGRKKMEISRVNSFKGNQGDHSVSEFSEAELSSSQDDFEGGTIEVKGGIRERKDRIRVSKPPRIRGRYEKVGKMVDRGEMEMKMYAKKVDLFLEESADLFAYQDYHDLIRPDEPQEKIDWYYETGDNYRLDEYTRWRSKENKKFELEYVPVPPKDGVNYIPPLFRFSYELWIWKVGIQNSAKIKNKYFNPEVCNINEVE